MRIPEWWDGENLRTRLKEDNNFTSEPYGYWHHDHQALRFNGWATLDELEQIIVSIKTYESPKS